MCDLDRKVLWNTQSDGDATEKAICEMLSSELGKLNMRAGIYPQILSHLHRDKSAQTPAGKHAGKHTGKHAGTCQIVMSLTVIASTTYGWKVMCVRIINVIATLLVKTVERQCESSYLC